MINPDDFKAITEAVEKGETLTADQVKDLIKTVYEMDANMVILQYGLELAIENNREVLPAMAERILSMAGRTDGKSKKRVAKYAAEVTARAELAVQLYLSGATEEAQKMLAQIGQVEDTTVEETTDESVPE